MNSKRRASPPPQFGSGSSSSHSSARHSLPLSNPRHAKINIRRASSFGLPNVSDIGKRRTQVIIAVLGALGFIGIVYSLGSGWGGRLSRRGEQGQSHGGRSVLTLQELQALQAVQDNSGTLQSQVRPSVDNALAVTTRPDCRKVTDDAAKYLAYLPHGGYHTQRIALENALTLAAILKRTLLLPPVWLGKVPPYATYDALRAGLEGANKRQTKHCVDVPDNSPLPPDCQGYFDFVNVDWPFLVDVANATDTWVERRDFDAGYFTRRASEGGLGVPIRQIHEFHDTSRHHFRIFDGATQDLRGYTEAIKIEDLQGWTRYRILSFGAMDGAHRLSLTKPEHLEIRNRVLAGMHISNNKVVATADKIATLLGGEGGWGYVGAHARLNERVFRWTAGENMRELFWMLARSVGATDLTIAKLERQHWFLDAQYRREVGRPQTERGFLEAVQERKESWLYEDDSDSAREYPGVPQILIEQLPDQFAHDEPPALNVGMSAPVGLQCPGKLHNEEALLPFNTPIFLATDITSVTSSAALSMIANTFPCLFTLSSPEIREIVQEEIDPLVSVEEGTPLAPFLTPLLDAAVAARGREVHGTKGSTFSRFVTDVEGRSVHGYVT